MQFNTYTVAGAHIAVWLVNHPEPDAAALAAELHRREVHEPAGTTADVAALRPWTARLREVFEAPPSPTRRGSPTRCSSPPTAAPGWSATARASPTTSITRPS